MLKKYVVLWLVCLSTLMHANENRFIACDNSLEAIGWVKEFISHAEQSIEFSPCYFGGPLLEEIVELFEQRLKACPDLQISLLMSPIFLEKTNYPHLERLQQLYPRRFHFVFTTSIVDINGELSFIDNHIKTLIVDETYFVLGGTNYDYVIAAEGTIPMPRYIKEIPIGGALPSGARDQDVAGAGPLAKSLRELFYKMMAIWSDYNANKRTITKDVLTYRGKTAYFELPDLKRPCVTSFETSNALIKVEDKQIKMIVGGPEPKPNAITSHYCELINNAKSEILIGNLYFAPTECILKALMRAAKRGVKITIITNGVTDRSPAYNKLWSCANRVCYIPVLYGEKFELYEKKRCQNSQLCQTKVYEYYVQDMLYHKKVMIVDKEHFLVGSYNLGARSDLSDYEIVLSIYSKSLAEKALQVFRKDLDHSLEVPPKKMQDWYFDLLTVYEAEFQRKIHPLI